MNQSSEWNESQSIQLIRSMIEATKYQVYEEKFLYFLWGYGVIIAGLSHYVLGYIVGFEHPYVSWLLMPVLGLVNFGYMRQKHSGNSSRSWAARVLKEIWIGMLFGNLCVVAGGFAIGWHAVYPFFMILYGVAAFATGTALEYKWLIIGGFISLVIGGVAFFLVFQFQLILLVAAVFMSFVLPAHLMQKK